MSDFIIAGVGGQGTVLASKLLAQAALSEGRTVRTAETIGMAQRGGSVLGHVRIATHHDAQHAVGAPTELFETSAGPLNDDAPLSPLVPLGHADVLIGFEPGESVRALDYLKPAATVVTAAQVLEPVTATLSNRDYDGTAELDYLRACEAGGRLATLAVIDGAAICAELASTRVLNVVLLGAALELGALNLPAQALMTAIETLVKPHYIDLNKTALAKGRDAVVNL